MAGFCRWRERVFGVHSQKHQTLPRIIPHAKGLFGTSAEFFSTSMGADLLEAQKRGNLPVGGTDKCTGDRHAGF